MFETAMPEHCCPCAGILHGFAWQGLYGNADMCIRHRTFVVMGQQMFSEKQIHFCFCHPLQDSSIGENKMIMCANFRY
jgi:hypothetical protein